MNGSLQEKLNALRHNLNTVIRGKAETVEQLLVALIAGGHVLIEDVPGVGKTTLSKALAKSLDLDFRRIQFTPDLLPSDILGTPVFLPQEGRFEFKAGPVFTNILLADEINRASPRTQSALLECMSEHQVTSDGETRPLPPVFLVIATENPVELHGTYPLPEAQLDRFLMRLRPGYPDAEAELAMLSDRENRDPMQEISSVIGSDDILQLQQEMRAMALEQSVKGYLTRIIRATREDDRFALGCSPRALLMLADCARAKALLDNRDYVAPEDVRDLTGPVLAHRLPLTAECRYANKNAADILQEIVRSIPMPV